MNKITKVLSYVVAIFFGVAVTMFALVWLNRVPGNGDQSKLDQLETLIQEKFIGEVDQTAMEDAAAEAMVDSLGDRWSYYISAADYQAYKEQMQNSYVGVGITVALDEETGDIHVTQVTEGGPAEEAGVLAGDVIIVVDGQDLVTEKLTEVRNLVRGQEGTCVELTVLREGKEMTFSVERREIMVIVAQGEMLEEGIGLVTITNFDERCASETIAAIEMLLDQGATSLIFDVRNNPGGYKDELVEVLDYLLPEGPLFRSEDYEGNVIVDYSQESCLDIPMAVLVNGESYSAAEFFAAALSEYDAATVVGEQTCGKGYFQNTFKLSDGSAVGLSVGKYYTPNGVSLAEVGITPDVEVEVDDETFAEIYAGMLEPEEDPQVQAAVEALKAA